MFQKFTKLENLARFEKTEDSARHTFMRWNVIFADNGRGKSTLTSVFRSISENEPHHLLARQTLGQVNPPKVSLSFDVSGSTQIANFNGVNWDKNPARIYVFDQEFIDANVHIGGKVDYQQKRGLYEIFVGKQTGSLVDELNNKDEKIREINPHINELHARILGHIKSGIEVPEFIALAKDENADVVVAELYKQLRTLQNKTVILKSPVQQKLSFTPPDLKELNTHLKTDIKILNEDVKEKVKQHLSKLSDLDSENWVERGHQLSEHMNGDCPYCGQLLERSEIAGLYGDYFSKEYVDALKTLNQYREQTLEETNVGSLVTLGRLIAENEARYKYWTDEIKVTGLTSTTFEIDKLQTVLTELRGQLSEVFDKKLKDPLAKVDIPEELSNSIDRLNALVRDLNAYNGTIQQNIGKVNDFKTSLMGRDDTVEITKELNLARDQQTRHSASVNTLCVEYLKLLKDKKQLEKEKVDLRSQLDTASEKLLTEHEGAINEFLEYSGAAFKLKKINNDHRGGKPNSSFVLEINGEEINVDSADENAPNLNTALSAGDKTTLAFAVFVSCVLQESKMNELILIIDDPISSLDSGRRDHTMTTIFSLFEKVAQGILLSHDPDFLYAIWQRMGVDPTNRSSFEIKRKGSASKIEAWDVEKLAESEQKVRIQVLQKFADDGLVTGQNLKDIVKEIRPAIEHCYKAAYPKEFPSADSLGMFIGNVKNSSEAYLANVNQRIDKLDNLNAYITPYSSHDGQGPAINETELTAKVKIALDLIRS